MNDRLVYDKPASKWDEALPVGCGRLGAMVWGGYDEEILDLNEDRCWSGFPRDRVNYEARRYLSRARELLRAGDYGTAEELIRTNMQGGTPEAYQPIGRLIVSREDRDEHSPGISRFTRELDLSSAVCTVSCEQDGVKERRSVFASYPHSVIALKWEIADDAAPSSMLQDTLVSYETPHPHEASVIDGRELRVKGRLPSRVVNNWHSDHPEPVLYEEKLGMRFVVRVRIVADGKTERYGDTGRIRVTGARSLTVFVTTSSNFREWNVMPDPEDPLPDSLCKRILDRAEETGWDELLAIHAKDYGRLYDRVRIELGSGDEQTACDETTTDARIKSYGEGDADPGLECLYFNYGRYLLIASSREGSEPANLQGIWNPLVQPPWFSGYTVNINTEMNYSHAETCALPECVPPLLDFIEELAESGERTAKVHYGCRGWVAHHNSDLWRMSIPTDGDPVWAFWPFGGAWLARAFWEHYCFDPDPDFLVTRAWPVIRGVVLFLLDWLQKNADGRLESLPSTSPENHFVDPQGKARAVCVSSAMDLSIARDVLVIAERILSESEKNGIALEYEPGLAKEIAGALERLPMPSIAGDGRIREWGEDFPESEPGHRHLSHLFCLYPSDVFSGKKDFEAACAKSIKARLDAGSGSTGWSAAYIACCLARLGDGNAAYGMINRMISRFTLPNLFDTHPPFQIDGNFGGTAAMAEMLVQSHGAVVRLLPALPAAWQSGSVRGLRVRGGASVDVFWDRHGIVRAAVTALADIDITIAYGDRTRSLRLVKGQRAALNSSLGDIG